MQLPSSYPGLLVYLLPVLCPTGNLIFSFLPQLAGLGLRSDADVGDSLGSEGRRWEERSGGREGVNGPGPTVPSPETREL